jgi:hypothetical protein
MSQQHADATADPPSGQPSEVAVVTNQSNDRDIDTALYIDNERFFRDLQDMGLEMTTAERNKYNGNKKKKKRGSIRYGTSFYSTIFELSKDLHKHYQDNNTLLPNIRKNNSEAVHMLGKQLLEMRQTKSRSDIHTVVTDANQMEMSRNDEFKEKQTLSFLSQTEWLKWVISKWGHSDEEEKKGTPDDFLRAIGILFHEDMREFIPYALTLKDPKSHSSDPSARMSLDSWNGKRNLLKRLLKEKFIDPEVKVLMHEMWDSDEAREKIDERVGTGAYDKLMFNPNNPDRINIAWSETEVWTHLSTGLISYNKVMSNYKMNTGGGDGNPLSVQVWEEREPLSIVGYTTNREIDMHNTPVHLWDKEYGFPLTVVREAGAPDGTGVDDDDDDYFDFTTQYDDEERGDTGSTASPNNRNSNATPNNRNSNRKQKLHGFKASRDNLQMLSVMKTQSAIATKEREKHFSDIKELAREVFKSTGDEQGDKIDMQAKLQQTIATTKAQLKEAEKELKTLKRKRRDTKEMVGCSPSNHQLKKKLKSLDKKAMSAAIEVSTFEKAFGSQLKQLRKLSGGTGETDDAEDDIDLSEISDDSESDSDA